MTPATGAWELHAWPAGRPLLISHRGFALALIENTEAAFAAASAIGADGFETDIRVTADGVPICHRDETLIRLGGIPDRVSDLRYAAIQSAFPAVCRLSEALNHASNMAVVLDIKAETAAEVGRIADNLRASPHARNVLAGVRSIALSRLLAAIMPDAPQFGFGLDPGDLDEFRANGGTWVRLAEPQLTRDAMLAARRLGFRVLVGIGEDYPGNVGPVTAGKIGRCLAMRPDAIMLDDPRQFRDVDVSG
jgi:glycerophosphoryl diester phosphodiesterase